MEREAREAKSSTNSTTTTTSTSSPLSFLLIFFKKKLFFRSLPVLSLCGSAGRERPGLMTMLLVSKEEKQRQGERGTRESPRQRESESRGKEQVIRQSELLARSLDLFATFKSIGDKKGLSLSSLARSPLPTSPLLSPTRGGGDAAPSSRSLRRGRVDQRRERCGASLHSLFEPSP